jgi:hypothetical protein
VGMWGAKLKSETGKWKTTQFFPTFYFLKNFPIFTFSFFFFFPTVKQMESIRKMLRHSLELKVLWLNSGQKSRVARFYIIQYTKRDNINKRPHNIPNCHKAYQTTIKDIKMFNSKAFQNVPKLGICFEHKVFIWQPWEKKM